MFVTIKKFRIAHSDVSFGLSLLVAIKTKNTHVFNVQISCNLQKILVKGYRLSVNGVADLGVRC